MRTTPQLPDWVRHARVAGYENAHQLCPSTRHLYGTETLYGDWNGQVLLLAKDWGPSSILLERIADGDDCPYRHCPRMRANTRLQQLARPHEHLGMLYGSALANLLRNDGVLSGALPNRRAALEHGARVLAFVRENMPRLRWIVCLGQDAWDCACMALSSTGDWREHRDAGRPLGPLIAAYHPSARESWRSLERPWGVLAQGSQAAA